MTHDQLIEFLRGRFGADAQEVQHSRQRGEAGPCQRRGHEGGADQAGHQATMHANLRVSGRV